MAIIFYKDNFIKCDILWKNNLGYLSLEEFERNFSREKEVLGKKRKFKGDILKFGGNDENF